MSVAVRVSVRAYLYCTVMLGVFFGDSLSLIRGDDLNTPMFLYDEFTQTTQVPQVSLRGEMDTIQLSLYAKLNSNETWKNDFRRNVSPV